MITNKLLVGMMLFCIILLSQGQDCCILNSIKAQGIGETRIMPNIAILYTSVIAQDINVQKALEKLQQSLDGITLSLKQDGVSSDDIRTTSINVYPKYGYTDGKYVRIGYTVYLSLTITIRGIEKNNTKIGQVLDSLADYRAITISGFIYDTQDPNSGKTNARNNAYNDAFNKAKQYAQLTGRKLGKAIVVEQTQGSYVSSTTPGQYYLESALSLSPQVSNSTNYNKTLSDIAEIPIGMIQVTVLYTITWQII